MSKPKKKRRRSPFTDAQVATIRTIVREEIANGYAPIPQMEPIAVAVNIEDIVGEPEIDRARKKLEAGIDLTPTNFPLPPGASYFGRDDNGKELHPGFTDAYLRRLNESDDSLNEAYVKTCNAFNLPIFGRE